MEHMTIADFGTEHCPADKEAITHPFSHHTLHFIYSGSGYFNGIRVSAGQIFLCRGGEQATYYPAPEDPWYYGWIGGSGILFEQLISEMGFSESCYVRTMQKSPLIEILISAGTSSTEQEYRCGLFYAIAGLQIAEAENALLTAPQKHLKEAEQYIETLSGVITPKQIAQKMNLSRAYLRNLFSANFGISLQEYILRYRMQCAAELIASTDLPISEIAFRCGYSDPLMFSRMFRKYQQQSPTQYRRSTQNFICAVDWARKNDPRYSGENIEVLRDRVMRDDRKFLKK